MNHLRLGLVLEDTSPDAQSFAKSLMNSRYFEITLVRNRQELHGQIVRVISGALSLSPPIFQRLDKGLPKLPRFKWLQTGASRIQPASCRDYVQGAWLNWLQQESISSDLQGLPLIQSQSRFWYNEQLESRYF